MAFPDPAGAAAVAAPPLPSAPSTCPHCVLRKRVNDLPGARADHVTRLGLDSRSLYFEPFVPAA